MTAMKKNKCGTMVQVANIADSSIPIVFHANLHLSLRLLDVNNVELAHMYRTMSVYFQCVEMV